jgi:hypothetical protein
MLVQSIPRYRNSLRSRTYVKDFVAFYWLTLDQLMAFSFNLVEIGPQRKIYLHMALIRIEDLQVATRIEPPPIRAVRGPRAKRER